MSKLTELKQTIDDVAQQAKATAGSLNAFKSKFSQSIGQVQATIGGSTQRKDQEVISAITQAQARVDAAAEALVEAARIAKGYGESL